jgi:hypothetical protein
MRRYVLLSVIALSLAACASSSPKQRSEFGGHPGALVDVDWNKSTRSNRPLKAARLVYKGRVSRTASAVYRPRSRPRLAPPDLVDQLGEGYHAGLREIGQLAACADLRGHLLHLGRGIGHAPRHSHDDIAGPLTRAFFGSPRAVRRRPVIPSGDGPARHRESLRSRCHE